MMTSGNIEEVLPFCEASQLPRRRLGEPEHGGAQCAELDEAYRNLVDHSLQGLVIFQDGRAVFANQAMAGIIGYPVDEILAMSPDRIREVVHPEDREVVWDRHRKRLAGEPIPQRYEMRGIRKDGSICWLELYASHITHRGRPAVQAAYIDITARKQVEEKLRESEGRYRALVETQRDLICRWLPDTTLTFVNRAYCQYFGKTRDELLGTPWLSLIPESEREVVRKKYAELVRRPTFLEYEHRAMAADGITRWQVWNDIPIFDPSGRLREFQSVARDITRQKKAERKLLDYQNKLRRLAGRVTMAEERERHRIALGLHDQIGQRLAMVKLSLQALRPMTDDATAEVLAHSCEEIDNLAEEVRSLSFDLSNSVLYTVGLPEAVEAHLERNLRQMHGIAYEFHRVGDFAQLDSEVKIMLFRSCRELVNNVVKHADAQHVSVKLTESNVAVMLRMEDDGKGFDPKEPEVLGANSSRFGLFSIDEQAQTFGGALKVRSKPGRGTSILLTIPARSTPKLTEGFDHENLDRG